MTYINLKFNIRLTDSFDVEFKKESLSTLIFFCLNMASKKNEKIEEYHKYISELIVKSPLKI